MNTDFQSMEASEKCFLGLSIVDVVIPLIPSISPLKSRRKAAESPISNPPIRPCTGVISDMVECLFIAFVSLFALLFVSVRLWEQVL